MMISKLVLTIFLIFFNNYFVLSTQVTSCTDGTPLPIEVDIVGCTEPPCQLVRGTNVVMLMKLKSPEPVDQLFPKVRAKALGITVPYPLPQPDGCQALTNTHCPLEVNEPATYKLEMPIEPSYPAIPLTLTFSMLYNKDQKRLACFVVDCQVVKA